MKCADRACSGYWAQLQNMNSIFNDGFYLNFLRINLMQPKPTYT